MLNDEPALPSRGSLRARGAAAISSLTLRQGAVCELEVWPDQVHVFQALPRLTPEAAPAMRRIAAFISQSLCDNGVDRVAG